MAVRPLPVVRWSWALLPLPPLPPLPPCLLAGSRSLALSPSLARLPFCVPLAPLASTGAGAAAAAADDEANGGRDVITAGKAVTGVSRHACIKLVCMNGPAFAAGISTDSAGSATYPTRYLRPDARAGDG